MSAEKEANQVYDRKFPEGGTPEHRSAWVNGWVWGKTQGDTALCNVLNVIDRDSTYLRSLIKNSIS